MGCGAEILIGDLCGSDVDEGSGVLLWDSNVNVGWVFSYVDVGWVFSYVDVGCGVVGQRCRSVGSSVGQRCRSVCCGTVMSMWVVVLWCCGTAMSISR